MSVWEIGTWLAVVILGPGALAIFILFLRDAKRIVREMKERDGKR
jgi:hypothetical protein